MQDRFRQASQATGGGVALSEIPFAAQINLRGDPGNRGFRIVVRDVLGVDIPTTPNTYVASSSISVLWMGPDEWLIVGDPGVEQSLVRRLTEGLQGMHSSVVDVSDARSVIELSGVRSRDLLAKGCSLDLHPRVFHVGNCAQTTLARANVILQLLEQTPSWRIYVHISFVMYCAAWLLDAMAEFRAR